MVRKGTFSSQSVSGSAFMAVDRSLARLLSPAADNPKSQSRNAAFPASNLAALPNLEQENRGTSGDLSCAQVLRIGRGDGGTSRPGMAHRAARTGYGGEGRNSTAVREPGRSLKNAISIGSCA